jgi:hypothetical protein
VIAQFVSKFGAGVAALAVLGSISSVSLPAAAHSAPAVVADAAQSTACGSIAFGSTATDTATIRNAEDCLQRAYSSCSPNQLAVTWDTATEQIDRVLTVEQGDQGCQIIDQVTHTAKSTGLDSTNIYTCGSLSADSNGITVRKCGEDGDVLVPTAG